MLAWAYMKPAPSTPSAAAPAPQASNKRQNRDNEKPLVEDIRLLGRILGDVIRAFTYFSHLANLAEDRHHIRRRAIHERAGHTQEGSIDVALQRLRWAGITPRTISQTLAHS